MPRGGPRKQRSFKLPTAPWRETSDALRREAQGRIDRLIGRLSSELSADGDTIKARGKQHTAEVVGHLREDWSGLCESRSRWHEVWHCWRRGTVS